MVKEYLYVGHYIDINGNYMLKIGTTNDLKRRASEHNQKYRKAKTHTMPKDGKFVYDWTLPLSKYNTLRYEDSNRQAWQDAGIGTFVRNDRFNCGATAPQTVTVKIKKEYVITLGAQLPPGSKGDKQMNKRIRKKQKRKCPGCGKYKLVDLVYTGAPWEDPKRLGVICRHCDSFFWRFV